MKCSSPLTASTMSIEITREDERGIGFTMRGVSAAMANGIRRTILSSIPTVAMTGFPDEACSITFEKNTGAFNNEILKQRLECVPVHVTERSVDLSSHTVRLDVAASEGVRDVTTGDFSITWGPDNAKLPDKVVKQMFPADPITGDFILITRLNPSIPGVAPAERLVLAAKLEWTDGSNGGTATVAPTCSYAPTPDIERQEAEWITVSAGEESIAKTDFLLGPGAHLVIPGSYDWTLETTGVYTPRELVTLASDILSAAFSALIETLSEPGTITPVDDGLVNCHAVRVGGDAYSVGYLLQTKLYETHCSTDNTNYVGFRKDHPHDSHARLRIALADAATPAAVAAAIKAAADSVIAAITTLRDQMAGNSNP
jgi:DNA-directed RNA polymerase subunit L